MNTAIKLVDVVLVGTLTSLLLTGCPDDKSSEETGPASGLGETSGAAHASSETGAETPPSPAPAPERPEAMPMLCTIDGGKWCSGCLQGAAGPLCCSDATCAPWAADGPACVGSVGWCPNYTTAHDIATCHDN